jgi:hypothetical protein
MHSQSKEQIKKVKAFLKREGNPGGWFHATPMTLIWNDSLKILWRKETREYLVFVRSAGWERWKYYNASTRWTEEGRLWLTIGCHTHRAETWYNDTKRVKKWWREEFHGWFRDNYPLTTRHIKSGVNQIVKHSGGELVDV